MIIATGYTKVRESSFDRTTDILNEVKLIVIMYHILHFTMYVPLDHEDLRIGIGFSCAVVIILSIVTSFGVLIIFTIKNCRNRCRLMCSKRHFKKRFDELTIQRT